MLRFIFWLLLLLVLWRSIPLRLVARVLESAADASTAPYRVVLLAGLAFLPLRGVDVLLAGDGRLAPRSLLSRKVIAELVSSATADRLRAAVVLVVAAAAVGEALLL